VLKLSDILSPQRIKVPLKAADKRGAIEELVGLLNSTGMVTDRDKVLTAVLERENTRTTGIGNGLAIPHGKCGEVKDLAMAIGRCSQPVDFESIDGKPVTLVILLVSPMDKTGPHIQALAHICRLLSDDALRKKLNEVPTPQELFDLLLAQEKATE